jgi:hypothetical protein
MAVQTLPDSDDGSPRMVTLFRDARQLMTVDAVDAEDAARRAAVLVLSQDGRLRIGDVLQVTRA